MLCDLIINQALYFYDIGEFLFILLMVGLLLYISIFEINTLRGLVKEDNDNIIKYCRKCGVQLLDGSIFCRQCGTQIITEENQNEMQ